MPTERNLGGKTMVKNCNVTCEIGKGMSNEEDHESPEEIDDTCKVKDAVTYLCRSRSGVEAP